ncbi:MAG: acyltransferase family protein [Bryobacteraceae bacterium]
MSVNAQKKIDPAPAAAPRLVSLDAFRGFTMFWIVGGKSLLMALRSFETPVAAGIAYQLNHSEWEGLRFYDVIWPAFMLMVGMSIPFAYARRRLSQSERQIRLNALKRAAILFLLGSLRTSISSNRPELVELSSALQPIALAYLVASFLAGASRKVQIGVAAGILGAYALLLHLVPPASYLQGDNLVRNVDLWVLGRTHAEGWGTVLSAIPTISTTLLGLLLGQMLMGGRAAREKLKIIALTGAACVALGFALSPAIPVIMKLWTTSYGLASAGWACLEFLLFYAVIDVLGYRKWAFPFVVIGMNALAIYVGQSVVRVHSVVGIFSKPIAAHLGAFGPLFAASAVLAVEWLVLYWMYRRKIFLRA